jgi:Fe-S-cluster-containing dehydrogenase component
MQFHSKKVVAEKCHLCYHQIGRSERPACVDQCIGRCIYFETIEEILARLRNNCWKYGFDVVPSFKRLYDSRNLVTLIGGGKKLFNLKEKDMY